MASGPWIRTDATRGSLSLPGVVTEPGGSAVGELTVTSCCEWPLVVYMETSDPGVVFQLQNENLRNGDPDDDPADWNQLFNEIDQIDRIELAPGASTTVVISFRVPEIRASPTPNSTQLSSSRRGQDLQSGASKSALSERHAITTATATIELRAVHTAVVSQQSGGGGAGAADGDRTSEAAATASNETTAGQMADGLGATATAAAVASGAEAAAAAAAAASLALPPAPPPPPPPPPPPLQLTVVARQCVSVLRTDTHELSFDACVIGASAVRDFTVWNCSEVPLRFRLSELPRGPTQPTTGWPQIEFLDADADLRLPESGQLVLGYSHARVRAYLLAGAVGQYTIELEVSNLNDVRNHELLRVHVLVTAQPQAEGLRLSGDGTLDFGSCYAGMPTRTLLSVRNTSGEALDVHFASELPDEVSFTLAGAHPSGVDEEEGVRAVRDDVPGAAALGGPSVKGDDDDDRDWSGLTELGEEASIVSGRERRRSGLGARRIEELALLPGRERAVYVVYTPKLVLEPVPAEGAPKEAKEAAQQRRLEQCALERKAFRIDIKGHSSGAGELEVHTRSVQCRARVCASFVSVHPTVYQLGDCDIQTHKAATVLVRNHSELPAELQVSIISKVLTCADTNVRIGPKQAHELRFDFVPRRLNPYYRKQVTITNVHNAHDEHVIEFVANNVDRHNISFHSLFYSLALMRPPTAKQPALAAPLIAPELGGSILGVLSGGGLGLLGSSVHSLGSLHGSSSNSSGGGRGVGGFDAEGLAGGAVAGGAAALQPLFADARELGVMPPDKCRIDFEDVVAGCLSLRAVCVHNTSASALRLRLRARSDAGSLAMYVAADSSTVIQDASRIDKHALVKLFADQDEQSAKREQLLDRFEERAVSGGARAAGASGARTEGDVLRSQPGGGSGWLALRDWSSTSRGRLSASISEPPTAGQSRVPELGGAAGAVPDPLSHGHTGHAGRRSKSIEVADVLPGRIRRPFGLSPIKGGQQGSIGSTSIDMLPSFPHKGGSSSTDSLPRLPLHVAGTAGTSGEAHSDAPPSPLPPLPQTPPPPPAPPVR